MATVGRKNPVLTERDLEQNEAVTAGGEDRQLINAVCRCIS